MNRQQDPVRPWEAALQRLLWGALALVLAGVGFAGAWSGLRGGLGAWWPATGATTRLPAYASVPDFALTERSGRLLGAGELRGKVWVATFIYTRCPDTCPLQSAEMARLQREFEAEEDLRLVSVTVDPERDTLAVLSRYAARFSAHPDRWLFLTGDRAAIRRLVAEGFRLAVVEAGELPESPLDEAFPPSRGGGGDARGRTDAGPLLGPALALAHAARGGPMVLHSARFVLVDRASRIRGYYDSTDPERLRQLRRDIRVLLREA
jgi:cytochrome oxidase Cu insertion factor (SCO1/SenC/PrrC family)